MPNFSWTQVDTNYVKAQDYHQNFEISLLVKEYMLKIYCQIVKFLFLHNEKETACRGN